MVSPEIVEAKTNNNERNVKRLHEALNQQKEIISTHEERIRQLEANIAMLAADIANTKQLMGYLHGRGTGPSVKS